MVLLRMLEEGYAIPVQQAAMSRLELSFRQHFKAAVTTTPQQVVRTKNPELPLCLMLIDQGSCCWQESLSLFTC